MRNKVIIISSIAFILLFFNSSAFSKKDQAVHSGNGAT
jgi:multidrug efflux system membrane fusion protein